MKDAAGYVSYVLLNGEIFCFKFAYEAYEARREYAWTTGKYAQASFNFFR